MMVMMALINKFRRRLHWVFLVGGMYSLVITAGCGVLPLLPTDSGVAPDLEGIGETPVQISEGWPGEKGPITRAQLQAALMDFADRFAATMALASEKFEGGQASPEVRLGAARLRFYPLASVFQVAAGQDPGIALLDMVVQVTLSRIVWEEYWQPQVYGERAEVLTIAFRRLETDIWSIAARVLTKGQLEELRDVILDWRREHPGEMAVSFFRFSDFGELRPDSPLAEATRPGGFFPEVSEAAQAADEIRLFGDRAMYLMSRMQVISNFQIDLAYRELITEPEIRQALADSTRFTDISERFAGIMEQLPQQVAKERSSAIKQLAQAAYSERKRLMEDLFAGGEGFKGLFTDLRQIIEAGNELATRINTAATSIDTLATRFDTSPDQERLSLGDYRQIVSEFSLSAKQLNTLVRSVDELLTSAKLERPLPVAFKFTDRVETLGQTWMKESFILGMALILMFFITLLVYRLVSQRLMASRKGQTLTAVLLAAGAAWISGYLAFYGGAPSQAVVPASDPNGTGRPQNAVYRTTGPVNREGFQGPMIQGEVPAAPILTPSSRSAQIPDPQSFPAQGIKGRRGTPENTLQLRTPAPQALTVAYSIQLGSFRNPNRAAERMHLFKSLGLEAFSRRVDLPDKGVFHRVLVGTFGTRGQARAYQDRLQEEFNLSKSLIISSARH
jgi:hypothetical protein